MPNYVFNTVTIEGSAEELEKVKALVSAPTMLEAVEKEVIFSFHNIVPEPTNKPIGWDWHGWRVENWGTKWDVVDVEDVSGENNLIYKFDTAWAPPLEIMQALSEKFPKVHINLHFVEEQGWGAIYDFNDGDDTIQEEWDIPETHADSMKHLESCYRCEGGISELFDDCPKDEAEAPVNL